VSLCKYATEKRILQAEDNFQKLLTRVP